MALDKPPRTLASTPLTTVDVDPSDLIRITRFNGGEPYFGKSGAYRFDDPSMPKRSRFGTCYLGLNLRTAIAETVLHDLDPVKGRFWVPVDALSTRYVVQYQGSPLRLANLTGVPLKLLGADASLSSITPYDLPQRWARALHKHPATVDGLLFMSRHVNTEQAIVLFDRAASKLTAVRYTPLFDYPGSWRAAEQLRITII